MSETPNTFEQTFTMTELPDVSIVGRSTMTDDEQMTAVFEVLGGRGRITIEYDGSDPHVIQTTDDLTKVLNPAIWRLAELNARQVEQAILAQMFGR